MFEILKYESYISKIFDITNLNTGEMNSLSYLLLFLKNSAIFCKNDPKISQT